MERLFVIVLTILFWIIPCKSQKTERLFDKRDSTIYKAIKIGNQIWMGENLAWLPKVNNPVDDSYDVPYHYVYGYNKTSVSAALNTENYETYGVLYNWEAARTACPIGWHLPSDEEWKTLEIYLGMSSAQANKAGWRSIEEGSILKESGTAHWNSPNTGSTNSNNFSALPAGYRYIDGSYNNIGDNTYFWSSTQYNRYYAWYRCLHHRHSKVRRFCGFLNKRCGFSVRCVKDK